MKNVDQIIEEVYGWYLLTPEDAQHSFKTSKKKDLISLHHSLGRNIRNNFELWKLEWEPEIDSRGVDMSPYHPDEVSMTIIEKVWERAQNDEESKKKYNRFGLWFMNWWMK